MKFQKFTVINAKASTHNADEIEVLFNLDHIVSIKPIRISRADSLINGFWIRTTNGKKYRASRIPDELLSVIGEQYQGTVALADGGDELAYQ
jgi:hypothetical protein